MKKALISGMVGAVIATGGTVAAQTITAKTPTIDQIPTTISVPIHNPGQKTGQIPVVVSTPLIQFSTTTVDAINARINYDQVQINRLTDDIAKQQLLLSQITPVVNAQ